MTASLAKPATSPTVLSKPKCLVSRAYHISLPNESGFHFTARPSQPDSAPTHGTLGECSPIHRHCRNTQLHRAQDDWHSRSKSQGQQISKQVPVSELIAENAKLRKANAETTTATQFPPTWFLSLTLQHEKLVERHYNAKRTISKLKQSGRAKNGLQQRNLTLKATLQRVMLCDALSDTQSNADVKAALREALALATERIEELESKGEAVLCALEQLSFSEDDDEEGDGDNVMGIKPSLVEAEVAFRGVLGDESFREQRVNWKELLEE